MNSFRVAMLLSAVMASLCAAAPVRAAEPAKDATKRRGYDFTQPDPGEILPNPKTGVGSPPALREYETAHTMSDESGGGGGGAVGAPKSPAAAESMGASPGAAGGGAPPGAAGGGAAPAAKAGHEKPSKTAAAPPPPQPAPAADAPTPPAPPPSDYVRISLAAQVAAVGAAGPFAYRPSPAAEADPTLRVSEEAAWNRRVAALAASWLAWQAAHPRPRATVGASPAPPRPVVVEASPGRLVLSGAPASVTGDLPPDLTDTPAPSP